MVEIDINMKLKSKENQVKELLMTKKEIQKILKERFNIEVTLRPRKSTL